MCKRKNRCIKPSFLIIDTFEALMWLSSATCYTFLSLFSIKTLITTSYLIMYHSLIGISLYLFYYKHNRHGRHAILQFHLDLLYLLFTKFFILWRLTTSTYLFKWWIAFGNGLQVQKEHCCFKFWIYGCNLEQMLQGIRLLHYC